MMQRSPWSIAAGLAIVVMGSLTGCADSAPDGPLTSAPSAISAPSAPAAGPCVRDEQLLALMVEPTTPGDTSLYCRSASAAPGPDVVARACAGHPDAVCDPLRGYACVGQVAIQVAGPCPSGFVPGAAPEQCVGQWPRVCRHDTDCPVGSSCSESDGGICRWTCAADEACLPQDPPDPEAPTCDLCFGRCSDWEDGVDREQDRAVLYALPEAVNFDPLPAGTLPASELEDRAQRVRVSLSNPQHLASQEVRVIAARGLMVSCLATNTAPILTEYQSECTLSFAGDGARTLKFWTVPYQPDSPIIDQGSIALRYSQAGVTTTLSVPVRLDTHLPQETPPAGWYRGVARLRGTGVGVGTAPAMDAVADLPPATLEVPVFAYLAPGTGTALHLSIVDDTFTIGPEGRIDLRWTSTEWPETLGPPAVQGVLPWVGVPGATEVATSGPWASAEGLGGNTQVLFDFADASTTFLTWDKESDTLAAAWGMGTISPPPNSPIGGEAAQAGFSWVVSLQPTTASVGPPPVPTNYSEVRPTVGVIDLDWLWAVSDVVAPERFRPDEWTALHDLPPTAVPEAWDANLVDCLYRGGPLPGSMSPMESRCDTVLGPLDPKVHCAEFVASVAWGESALVPDLYSEYEVCLDGARLTTSIPAKECSCHVGWRVDPGFDGVTCDAADPDHPDNPVKCRFAFTTCPIDSAIALTLPTSGTFAEAYDDRAYVRAASCAMRIGSMETARLAAVTAEDGLKTRFGAFHPSQILGDGGDLMAYPTGVRTTLEDAWMASEADLAAGQVQVDGAGTSIEFGGAGSSLLSTRHELATACLDDLSREPSTWAWSPTGENWKAGEEPAPSLWPTVRTRLQELLATEGCISLGRFYPELDWLLKTATQEFAWYHSALQPDTAGLANRRAGALLVHRRLQQWLSIHGFLAAHGAEALPAADLLALDGEDDPSPYQLDHYLTEMDRGWGLILYPRITSYLAALPGEFLINPDYRNWVDARPNVNFENPAPHHEQHIGLPVAMLETLSQHFKLVQLHLERATTDIYAECSTTGETTLRDTVLKRSGEVARIGMWVMALANDMHRRAAEAAKANNELLLWEANWETARRELRANWSLLDAKVKALFECQNPLGISDDTLPIYFVDAATANQRFFASSDYLLSQWALPAVASAQSALAQAHQAIVQQRDSAIQQTMNQYAHDRLLEDLKTKYGTAVRSACGLEEPAEVVFDRFVDGQYDLETCHLVPKEDNPECASQVEQAIAASGYDEILQELLRCTEDGAPTAADIYHARRNMCVMARSVALYDLRSNIENYSHVSCYDLPGYDTILPCGDTYLQYARAFKMAESLKHERAVGNPAAFWHAGETFPTNIAAAQPEGQAIEAMLRILVQLTPGGAAAYDPTDRFTGDTWGWMDNIRLADCGRELRFIRDDDTPITVQPAVQAGAATSEVPLVLTLGDIERMMAVFSFPLALHSDVLGDCTVSVCSKFTDPDSWTPMLKRHGEWCDNYLMAHLMPTGLDVGGDIEHALFDPAELAQCFRGTLAEEDLGLIESRQSVRMAAEAVKAIVAQVDVDARQCILQAELGDRAIDAIAAYWDGKADLDRIAREAQMARGMFVPSGSTVVAPPPIAAAQHLVQMLNTALDFLLDDSADQNRLAKKLDVARTHLGNNQSALACWTQMTDKALSIRSYIEDVKARLLRLTTVMVSRQNHVRELRATLDDGIAALQRESQRPLPDMRHTYWLDEADALLDSRFAWAKRLTYLALRALEYELQQTSDLRADALSAIHPNQLEDVLRDLQREQAARGINGNRPEQKTVVLSLRDELLARPDRSEAPAGERERTPPAEFTERLNDGANAVYDAEGKYLGIGLPFTVRPVGPLHYRCAERMWTVNASIQGDLLGQTSPELPVFLLKRNTFQSQWCNGREDDTTLQSGSLTPSVNLFKDHTQPADPGEVEGYSWSYINAWLNVPRQEFYSERFVDGASDELAGRGLYGDYMLLLPWYGLLEHGTLDLSQVEDVLLRFDYVSVSNGSSLGSPPPGYDDGSSLPQMAVENLAIFPGANRLRLVWRNPNFPSLSRVVAVRRPWVTPSNVEDGDVVYECEGTACNRLAAVIDGDLNVGTTYYYAVFVVNEDGNSTSTTISGMPEVAPVPGNLDVTDGSTAVTLQWTNPSFEGFDGVWVMRRGGGEPTGIDESDGSEVVHVGTALHEGMPETAIDDHGYLGQTFFYRLFVVDDFGRVTGGPSRIGNFRQAPPTGLVATTDAQGVATVTWTNPAGFETVVVRRTSNGMPPWTVADGDLVYDGVGNSFTEAVAPNTTYFYLAFACPDSEGGSCTAGTTADSTKWIQFLDDFEVGTGNWSQVGGDNFDWTRRNGDTPTLNTGPHGGYDPSFLPGLDYDARQYYMYTNSAAVGAYKRAWLDSPVVNLDGATGATLSFEQHMYGGGTMGCLYVRACVDAGATCAAVVSSSCGTRADSWQYRTTSLSSTYLGRDVRLRFEGFTYGTSSDMAIDEVDIRAWGY